MGNLREQGPENTKFDGRQERHAVASAGPRPILRKLQAASCKEQERC